MKQQIVQISNIEFTEPLRIRKPADITDTYIYEYLYRQNDPMLSAVRKQLTMADIEAASHRGFVLAQLHNFYECTYDIEYITPNDVRYRGAAVDIEIYQPTDWLMDDADLVQSADIELTDEYYNVKHQTAMYMYLDHWIRFGYEAFVSPDNWKAVFHQIIYEYMREFLTVEII